MSYIIVFLIALGSALIGGIVGIAVGYAIAPLLGITSFEGAIGYFILLGCAPVGAVIGFIAGAYAGLRKQGFNSFGAVAAGFVIVVGGTGAVLAGAYWYMFVKKDLLNPDGAPPQLIFEIRLPAGTTMPAPADIRVQLEAEGTTASAELRPEQFRIDGERPVIVGFVVMMYRVPSRALYLTRAGADLRVFDVELPDIPPHASPFGPWHEDAYIERQGHQLEQSQPGDYEIRYRASWLNRDIKRD
jgi:hypothetical protein